MSSSGADQRSWRDVLRQRAVTGQVRIVHILFGSSRANRYFWRALRPAKPTWTDVKNRVDWLIRRDQAAAADFVRASLERTDAAGVVIGLAHYLPTREAAREVLADLLVEPEVLWPRIEDNSRLAGAFAGAGRLLLAADAVHSFVSWLVQKYEILSADMFETMDTVGYRFTAGDDLLARLKTGQDARHRLIISDSLDDRAGIDGLLPGARSATLLATSDTYGHADVERFKAKDRDVVVEHVRSRIPRFSQEYVDLYVATADIAVDVATKFLRATNLVDVAYRQVLELKLADYVFFVALRLNALELLFDDEDFDHIVVATENHEATDQYIRMLAAFERISTDPRVEVVSVSRRPSSFRRFWALIDAMTPGSDAAQDDAQTRTPADVIRGKAAADAAKRASRLPVFMPGRTKPSVLLVTSNSPAYNKATAAYAGELAKAGDVSVVHFGPDPGNLPELVAAQPSGDSAVSMSVLAELPRSANLLRRLIEEALLAALSRPAPDAHASRAVRLAWSAARADTERMASILAAFVLQLQAISAWFERMAAEGSLPDVVVLTPQRDAGVGAFAAVARVHGVPSIAVEPHAQDANYSRYVKVGADFYGVLSDYFSNQTADTFGIGADRIRVLGSPRQVAPADFDRAAAQAAARAELKVEEGQVLIGFFSQPSSWKGIRPVWSAALEATRHTGSKLLLKPHPEDSPSRIHQYLAMAEDGEVLVVRGDVTTAIDACDLVMTTYSIVGLDAMLRGAPVVALADGDTSYPLDLGSMLGVPVLRSAAELAKTIEEFKTDPSPFTSRTERFLAEEPQFVEGPGPRLRQLLDEVIQQGAAGIRLAADVPEHFFLDGPHPVFPV